MSRPTGTLTAVVEGRTARDSLTSMANATGAGQYRYLVCTVGGSEGPIIKSLLEWKPSKAMFICSAQSSPQVERALTAAREMGFGLDPGSYDVFELSSPDDLEQCLKEVHELAEGVEQWPRRGGDYHVVVDITGGTKCMSAALALEARRWHCEFSYVSGSQRDKGGLGAVSSGSEFVVHHFSPWDALGYQATEEFVVLFDQQAYSAAAGVAKDAMRQVSREELKESLVCLAHLAEAFAAWEGFDHKMALDCFRKVKRRANDLVAALYQSRAGRVLGNLDNWCERLRRLEPSSEAKVEYVEDLIANAQRREQEGRVEDAVARLYRAVEALAQLRLQERYGFPTTAKVRLEQLPKQLAERLAPRASDGAVNLGLQDSYELLFLLSDPVGFKFRELGLHEASSPLTARNSSILAHGFQRVPKKSYEKLFEAVRELLGTHNGGQRVELPTFPKLGPLQGGQAVRS